MFQSAQKTSSLKGSTQKFTEIVDIVEDTVLLDSGNACLVIQVKASNFALLSQEEQDAKISAYASFLNSLSFSIQILIKSKKIDITHYINLLNHQVANVQNIHPTLSAEQNQLLASYMQKYKEFVQELVKVNSVLDKQFYIIIPFSYLETGAAGIAKGQAANVLSSAKTTLHSKADSVLNQLARLSLHAKILEKEELIRLFHDVYNQGGKI